MIHHNDRKVDQADECVLVYQEIEEPTLLIESPIDSRILVNGGPGGVGKTFTVIERLAYLAESAIVDLSSVVVLCFSRSAVAVIRERLKEKLIKVRYLPPPIPYSITSVPWILTQPI